MIGCIAFDEGGVFSSNAVINHSINRLTEIHSIFWQWIQGGSNNGIEENHKNLGCAEIDQGFEIRWVYS